MDVVHTTPLNDKRGHVTDGPLCPCMPRVLDDGALIVHNSYDGREVGQVCMRALDALGLALAGHEHQWSDVEREAYDHAVLILGMHFEFERTSVRSDG